MDQPTPELITYGGIKLGWIQGVLIPCLLNIWGVMLFLRIAWIVAQAGIGQTVAIIALASVVCVITTLSLSAICTNGEVQGGGVYYLVSRSLGAELGASVGLIFAFANAVAASMNTIGFCESFNELLRSHGGRIIDNDVNDVRLVGAIALLLMCVICAVGMDWETKTQNFLIVIIVLAIFNYILGAFIGPMKESSKAQGFVGINHETAAENWQPDYRYSEGRTQDFFSVFAVYFPAVTGVQAGANICGDLKNPATAIPKGTLTALAISISSYLVMALLSGSGALRDASGSLADYRNNNLTHCKPDCEFGLHNNYAIMQLMSLWGPLIYAGCWAATLSTALTNLLSVPRLVQALGTDRIYPGLIFFSKRYGKHGEPYRGYVLVFVVSLLFLLIADLNAIAPLITNFYLASYALINFCTFHAAFVHHISWRPTFEYFNKWVSLAGFALCVTIMVITSWIMALATVIIFWTLYFLVMYRKPEASWGSSTEAQSYHMTVANILDMTRRREHAKSYNPQLLVLAGKPYARPALLDIGHLITKEGSFMVIADINSEPLSFKEREERQLAGAEWIHSRNNRGFYVLADGMSIDDGTRTLIRLTGLGKLAPNILLIGFQEKWTKVSQSQLTSYYRSIQWGFDEQLSVTIFRVCDYGLESKMHLHAPADKKKVRSLTRSRVLAVMNSSSDIAVANANDASDRELQPGMLSSNVSEEKGLGGLSFPITPARSMTHNDLSLNPEKNLDVWWLYDDGGLNILLPYIIADRGFKDTKMPMRIFALARQQFCHNEAKQYCLSLAQDENLKTLFPSLGLALGFLNPVRDENVIKCSITDILSKLRIHYSSLMMVTGSEDAPNDASKEMFQLIVQKFMTTESEPQDCLITSFQITAHQAKTNRYLRLRELLLEESANSGLIVITLPYPRKEQVSAALYMSWLEMLSRDLPPVLFVRGNKTVLQM